MNLTNATAGTQRPYRHGGPVFCLAMAATGTLGFVVAPGVSKPQEREFTVVTAKYAYAPAVIRVNKGDIYQGGIQGELQGPPTGIAGVESLLFDAGCPGQMVQLEITRRP